MSPPEPAGSLSQLWRRLQRIRAALTWVYVETWFYNLDNYRPDDQVRRELEAIASHRPFVIAICEAIGNRLPALKGYTLVRDASRESRENIAAYVRHDVPLRGHHWIDLKGTWPRTERPGIHPPRSFLVLQLGSVQLIVAHQAPKGLRNTWALQTEGINALVGAMAPWRRKGWTERPRPARAISRLRPRLLLWDSNRRATETGPGPATMAAQIGGRAHGGERIDNGVSRGGLEVYDVAKFGRVRLAGTSVVVQLRSDHQGAIRFRWRVRTVWLRVRTRT